MRTSSFRWALIVASATLVVALGIPPARAAAKPPSILADPAVTYTDLGKVYVCNSDFTNKLAIFDGRDVIIRSTRMFREKNETVDRGAVFFVVAQAGSPVQRILRTRFEVVGGAVRVGPTETILEEVITPYELALSPNGDKVAFVVADTTLYELAICSEPPCTLAQAVPLHMAPPDRYIQPIGGYSADGLSYYFAESGSEPIAPGIWKIDLSLGAPSTPQQVVELPEDGWVNERLLPSRTDPERLLFDIKDVLYVLDPDSCTGLCTIEDAVALGPGHAGVWSPGDTMILYLQMWRRSWVSGPLMRMNLSTGQVTQMLKFATSPDWAPPLPR